jgi:prepilin-type N-terminal cleavage/methylation domain-containing protein
LANPAARTAKGFSLLEVAMVLTIIGLISAIAMPRYHNFVTAQRADAAARRLTTDLATAKQLAKSSSKTQRVHFDVYQETYTMTGVPDPDVAGNDYTVYLAEEPYTASLVSADFEGSAELVIDGYGVPQAAGSITLQVGDYIRVITVDPQADLQGGLPIQKLLTLE